MIFKDGVFGPGSWHNETTLPPMDAGVLYQSSNQSPGCSTSGPAPCQCAWEGCAGRSKNLSPSYPYGRARWSTMLLISAQTGPAHCSYLESKKNRELSLPQFCNSNKYLQDSAFQKWLDEKITLRWSLHDWILVTFWRKRRGYTAIDMHASSSSHKMLCVDGFCTQDDHE